MNTPEPNIKAALPETAQAGQCMGMRQTGRAVIDDIICRLNRRIKHLETLRGTLPAELTAEQDDALWHIVVELERR